MQDKVQKRLGSRWYYGGINRKLHPIFEILDDVMYNRENNVFKKNH